MEDKKASFQPNFLAPQGVPLGYEGALYLTYNRSSQQMDVVESIRKTKQKMRGKQFEERSSPPNFCKRNSLAILRIKGGLITGVKFTKIGCDSWTCPRCNINKAIRTKYLIRNVIQLNNLGYFLTLTLNPAVIPIEFLSETQNRTHKYITKIFNSFLVSLKRDDTYRELILKYVWVIEFQQNGNAHMHILFNNLPHIKTVRALWVRVGGGLQMRVIRVQSIKGISNYVGDYIVKGIKGGKKSANTFNFFEKRFSISQSCVRPSNNSQELYPNLTLQEKYLALQSSGLEWIYNGLVSGEELELEL